MEFAVAELRNFFVVMFIADSQAVAEWCDIIFFQIGNEIFKRGLGVAYQSVIGGINFVDFVTVNVDVEKFLAIEKFRVESERRIFRERIADRNYHFGFVEVIIGSDVAARADNAQRQRIIFRDITFGVHLA